MGHTLSALSLVFVFFSMFIIGCGERPDYYDPFDAEIVSNRVDTLALINIKGPKIREDVKSFKAIGRNDMAWEFCQLFEDDVRSVLTGFVDVNLWNVKSNQFTKAGVDYVKSTYLDSRTPGMLSNFVLFEYKDILKKIEDCIMACKYSEAREWDKYLQEIIHANRTRLRAMGDTVAYFLPEDGLVTNAQILAWSIAGEPYYSKRMCPSMTLGQILTDQGRLIRRQAENFKKKGLSIEVVAVYYGENSSEELKRLFDWFLPIGLELDGSLKGEEVRYRDDGRYFSNKGEFSLLFNTIANTMGKDLLRLYNTFKTTDDIARFMVHIYYDFLYTPDEEIVSKFNERYEFLMKDLQSICVGGQKIDSTQAFKRISDVERAERKAQASKQGRR